MTEHRGAKARARILESGLKLFHLKGIQATSVDEILEDSGTGKSQFYHYFKNKDGLVHSVLSHFYQRLKSGQGSLETNIKTWEDLESWFGFFVNFQKAVGCRMSCPIGTIGNDLTADQELLRQDVRLIFDFIRHRLIEFFATLKGQGKIPSSVKPEELADFCICIMQGGLLVGKIRREVEPFENSVAHALSYLKGLDTRPDQRKAKRIAR